MTIIGFSKKTSKILPRIFCRHFRHVAVVVTNTQGGTMYQFVHRGQITKIPLRMRDLKILGRHGWEFVYITNNVPDDLEKVSVFTCVQLAKHAIGIRSVFIQTPDALYKKIRL